MRFYILDDDVNTVQMLSNLIEDMDLGKVVKTGTDPIKALKEIVDYNIDICLVDYLMPRLDGGSLMKQVKSIYDKVDFIMISQVSDNDMVSQSYLNGAEFFIHKPINIIELKKVVSHIVEKKMLNDKLHYIRTFLGEETSEKATPSKSSAGFRNHIERILVELGMMGEKGTYDLIKACEDLSKIDNPKEKSLEQWLKDCGERPKTVAQRMRRAMSKGLNNMAHLGIEDFGHETFVCYAYKLFDPQSIREETDYIKGKRKSGGKPNLYHFISGLIVEARSSE